jgi:alpha-glucoside transport system substrate-binding protein
MLKRIFVLTIIVMMVVAALPLVNAQDENTVLILGAYTEPGDLDPYVEGWARFSEETGVPVQYEGSSDFEVVVGTRIEAGDPPHIACFPQPGLMNRFADAAIDLSTVFDEATLQERYLQSWLDLGRSPDGKLVGVFQRATAKSLVWYSPSAFADAGYEVPTTWDELLDLTDQIVADGGTPWYAPMESGNATGWVGTDWIEDILLRIAPLETYDAWSVPASPEERVLFTSPEVTEAWEIMGDFLLNEDYIYGGILSTLEVPFFDTGVALIEGNAYLAKQGSYMPSWVIDNYPDLTIGPEGDLNYFYFPSIDEEFGRPMLVGGDVCSLYIDTPESRAVIEYMTTPESVEFMIRNGRNDGPHLTTPVDWYLPEWQALAGIMGEATSVRFDGSDLQPGAVGAGTFWSGVVDYINGGDLQEILESIDASWPS